MLTPGPQRTSGATFDVVEDTEDHVIIRDRNERARPSVTNDAEGVVAYLHRHGLGTRQLLYYDSDDDLDELVHDGAGHFTGFAPGPRRS